MIERVAEAMWKKQVLLGDPDEFIELARAAIEAMREPTEAMVAAGRAADWVGECESREGWSILPDQEEIYDDEITYRERPGIWRAMIDAALTATKAEQPSS